MNTIGDKIRDLRKKAGLSQEELGYEVGVSRQAVSKWEMGKSIPNTENLIALSRFFDVEVSYFIHDADMNQCLAQRYIQSLFMEKILLLIRK